MKWIILLYHSTKEGEEEPKGQQRNGCDMGHEKEIKSHAHAWLQWSRLVMVFGSK